MIKRTRKLFEKTIKLAKAKLPPEVDAPYVKDASNYTLDFNSSLWKKATSILDFKLMGTKNSCDLKTIVRVMCDKDNLYIGYDCKQTKPMFDKKKIDSKDESWTLGDHIETFIGDGQKSYYQLNAGFKGNKFDGHGFNSQWNGEWSVKTELYSDGWKAVVVIPFKTVGIDLSVNSRIKALFCRQYNKDKKEINCSWNGREVHRPNDFGIINIETCK